MANLFSTIKSIITLLIKPIKLVCIPTLVDEDTVTQRIVTPKGERVVGSYLPAWPIDNPFHYLQGGELEYTKVYEMDMWTYTQNGSTASILLRSGNQGNEMYVSESDMDGYAPAIFLPINGQHKAETNVPETLGYEIPEALCLGIEIEFSTPLVGDIELALKNKADKALFKADDSCGVELVTVPLVPNDMLDFVKSLQVNHLEVNHCCGVHIHLSRKYLTQSQLGGLVVFMNHPENLQYIEAVAGRAANRYCKQIPGKADTISTDRYEMVNLTNSETVEVRIFAGTNSTGMLTGYVTWLVQLIEWLDTYPTNYSFSQFLADTATTL